MNLPLTMYKIIRVIFGVLFLIGAVTTITIVRINPTSLIPSRSTVTRDAGTLPCLGQGEIITQELIASNDYFNGFDLMFTHSGRTNTNQNIVLLLDSNYNILHQETFSSLELKEGGLSTFLFEKPVFVGKGNRIYFSLYSINGDANNSASPLINPADTSGNLYISKINGNDIIGSIKNKTRHYQVSLMLQTYKTRYSQFWFIKILLYTLALIISLVIILYSRIQTYLVRIRVFPEWIFLFIALPFSVAFAFITPPTQVPDEGSHFFRAFELSEFQFFNTNKTIPVSLIKLDSTFGFLREKAARKITFDAITSQAKLSLEPEKRVPVIAPDYTIPYLPQALGIFIGKAFASSPLVLLYFGRLFNLLVAIGLIFFAIRIIPVFKWALLMVALMPKTLFLFGSISYDTLTISLSFFAMAIFLFYAYACKRNLGIKDLALLAFIVLLLLFCKPPFFLIGLLFFFIPPKKFGYLYKYVMISIGVVAIALVAYKAGPAAVSYISGHGSAIQAKPASPPPAATSQSLINPEEQLNYIRNNIPGYIRIMLNSVFVVKRSYIIDGFFGLLGWIDVELPKILIYSYLIFMVFAALVLSKENIKVGIAKKALLVLLLALAFVIIATGMYLYATGPGWQLIWGIQGRYFIPVAPLFFMLFYNQYFNQKLNILFSPRRKEYRKAKPKVKPVIFEEIQEKERLFDKSLYLVMACVCSFTLAYAVFITMVRYYNIL